MARAPSYGALHAGLGDGRGPLDGLTSCPLELYYELVIITLTDLPEGAGLAADELRLELACALYARGRIGKVAGVQMAGVDFFKFQQALEERGIPLYTEQMLADDVQALKDLFPR